MAPVMHEQMVQAVAPPPEMMQQPTHPQALAQAGMTAPAADQLVEQQQATYGYTLYQHGAMHTPAAPPQSWQTPNGIAPQQTHMAPAAHMMPRHPHEYQEDPQAAWNAYHHHPAAPPQPMVQNVPQEYDYRYREEPPNWVATASEYYHQQVRLEPSIRSLHLNFSRSMIRHMQSPHLFRSLALQPPRRPPLR